MNIKAQIRMWETMGILFVFFILLVAGIAFFSGVQEAGIKEESKGYAMLGSLEITELVSYLPELECPPTLEQVNCMDVLKIGILAETLNPSTGILPLSTQSYYFDLLGKSEITIKEIMPEEHEWTVYRNIDANTGTFTQQVPVSLYNPLLRGFGFGVLTVKVQK